MQEPRYSTILSNMTIERKPNIFLRTVLVLIVFILIFVLLNVYKPSVVPQNLRIASLNKSVNILILGCDEIFFERDSVTNKVVWKGRSDTILVLNCNPIKNTVSILNIPRDTRISIPGYGVEKINFLNSVFGASFTKKCLEKLLRIDIDHYVILNVKGISRIINEVGGVVIDVPQRMAYTDKTAMLFIDLYPGRQLLNGEQAVGFVRFRHDSLGDIGRIQRQQAFIKALFRKLIDPITFTKLPEILAIYKDTISTDLRGRDIVKIANFVRDVPASKQNISILPGQFGYYGGISYWVPSQEEINIVVKKLFLSDRNFDSVRKKSRINPCQIKVSILNGALENPEVIEKLRDKLNEYGYTVLATENFETAIPKTKIYAQKANLDVALQVKKDIGNFGDLLNANLGPPEADVTILAGKDLRKLNKKIGN